MRRVSVAVAVAAFACGGLEPLEIGECGNGVWEPEAGEDCDTNTIEGECGAVGRVGACRFVCRIDTDCPSGRLCGRDGVCRLPIRRFRPALGSPLMSIGDRITVDDLDSDGVDDLIGTNRRGAVVLFGGTDGQFVERRSMITGSPTGRAVTARLGDRASPAIVAPVGRGIHVAIAGPARTLSNIAHPAITVDAVAGEFIAVPIRMAGLRDLTLAIIDEAEDRIVIRGTSITAIDELLIDGGNVRDLAGSPATGDLDGDAVPTEEIAIAFSGDDRVRIFGLFCGASTNVVGCETALRFGLRAEVPILGGQTLSGGVALVDADGDGFDDLFFFAGGELWLAHNDRNGDFLPAAVDPRCDEWPLLIADLDGDERADFVTAESVLTVTSSRSAVQRLSSRLSQHNRWSFAAAGDFNRDGRTDVALAERDQRGIEIALGSRAPLFNTFFFDTPRTIQAIAAADFNGDNADDLAVLGDDNRQVVEVHYGSAETVLSAPVEMGRFDQVLRMLPAQIAGLAPDVLDYRSDLVVQSVDTQGANQNITVLFGTAEDQMIAPAPLGPSPDSSEGPIAVITGAFVGDGVPNDVLVLSDTALRLFQTRADGALDAGPTMMVMSTIGATPGDVLVTSGNLDGDPLDEVLIVTGAYPGVPRIAMSAPAMYVVDFDETIEVRTISLPAEVFAPSSVEITNLDTVEGNPSIVLAFTGARSPQLNGARGGVTILETNGAGRVEAIPETLLADLDGLGVLSVAAANIDSDDRIELLVLTTRHVFSLERRPAGYEWGPTIPLGTDDRAASIFGSMRSRDFNLDGLIDLVITNEVGCFVYLAVDAAGSVTR